MNFRTNSVRRSSWHSSAACRTGKSPREPTSLSAPSRPGSVWPWKSSARNFRPEKAGRMTEPLSHSQIEQLLPATALDILEGEELTRVASHLEGCTDCARLLDSYRDVVAGLAGTLPEQPFHPTRSERLRARLLARTGRVPVAAVPERRRRSPAAADRWIGWAVAAGLAGLLMVHHSFHRPVAYG